MQMDQILCPLEKGVILTLYITFISFHRTEYTPGQLWFSYMGFWTGLSVDRHVCVLLRVRVIGLCFLRFVACGPYATYLLSALEIPLKLYLPTRNRTKLSFAASINTLQLYYTVIYQPLRLFISNNKLELTFFFFLILTPMYISSVTFSVK